jgi:DNA gyrase/topoisomerase IV subunit A
MAEVPRAEETTGAVVDLSSPEYVIELTELEGRLQVLGGLLDASSRFHEVNEAIQFAQDRESALEALEHQPFGYSHDQADAILNMPMGWQSAAEVEHLREERERLASRRMSLREHATEVLAFHWFG